MGAGQSRTFGGVSESDGALANTKGDDEHTMKTRLYVGLDVHKETITIAVAEAGGRFEVRLVCTTTNDLQVLERHLRRIAAAAGIEPGQLSVVYEAGPCGFVIWRRLRQLGIPCAVVAPSLIPSRAGDRVKTDRRDALKLARLHRSGDLVAVHVPDAGDEAMRDLCRARADAVRDQRRARQQLAAFLLRNGYRYGGRSHWTAAHMRYLRELEVAHPAQKVILEEYLIAVDAAAARVARTEAQMRSLLESWARRPLVEALVAFKGFQLVSAMVIVGEIGDFCRFRHPRQLMAYLGLTPSEYSSAESRSRGPITKTGNGHARWMLVECARHYWTPPKVSKELSVRQEGQPDDGAPRSAGPRRTGSTPAHGTWPDACSTATRSPSRWHANSAPSSGTLCAASPRRRPRRATRTPRDSRHRRVLRRAIPRAPQGDARRRLTTLFPQRNQQEEPIAT